MMRTSFKIINFVVKMSLWLGPKHRLRQIQSIGSGILICHTPPNTASSKPVLIRGFSDCLVWCKVRGIMYTPDTHFKSVPKGVLVYWIRAT